MNARLCVFAPSSGVLGALPGESLSTAYADHSGNPGALAVQQLLAARGAAAPNFALKPISSTGPYTIVGSGSEIIIPAGGVDVTLDVIASGWSMAPPTGTKLGAYQATIDSSGYSSGMGPPLGPKRGLGSSLGAFQARLICSTSLRDCYTSGQPTCSASEGFCIENPRFLLGCCLPLVTIPSLTLDHEFGDAIQTPGEGVSEPHSGYCGTLVLTMPAEATGAYTIGFKADPNRTFMTDQFGMTIPGLTTTSGKITVFSPTGACCGMDDACTNTTQGSCAAEGGTYIDGQFCSAPEACCNGGGSCRMADPVCCASARGSVPLTRVSASSPRGGNLAAAGGGSCEGDADGDGVDALCGDFCPDDPLKTAPGACGCQHLDTPDTDQDGVLDCLDQCPGIDDRYAPGCISAIPATSTWGMAVLLLALLAGAKARFGRAARRSQPSRLSPGVRR